MAPSSRSTTRTGIPDLVPGFDHTPNSSADFMAIPRHSFSKSSVQRQSIDPYTELGTTGLRQFGGFVLEEWLPSLQGRKGAWVYREMYDNDPTVGAIMFAIRWLANSVEWRVEEGNDPKAAEFLESCMHDMEHTWSDFISEALLMLPYGWSLHEEVYKRRQGFQPGPGPFEDMNSAGQNSEDVSWAAPSKYEDGMVGWRKLNSRAQETLLRWGFDGYSTPTYMEQIDWHGGNHKIPLSKAILFRTQAVRNNPEGRSILRNAVVPYTMLKNLKAIEGMGMERDLAGIPVATPPEGVDLFAAGNKQLLQKVQTMVTNLRNDEYSGVVLPSAGWKLELMTTGGTKQFDSDKTIRRYRQDVAVSMLADWLLIGQDAVGSYAMVEVKSDMWGIALDGILDLICQPLNRAAVPRLLRLNGFDVTDPPEIHHGSARKIDLDRVGSFLQAISLAGAPIPWSVELLKALFADAGLPTNFEEQRERADELPAASQKVDPQDALQGERVAAEQQRAALVQKSADDRPVYAVDFDGVIRKRGPHKTTDEGAPIKGAKSGLAELSKHYQVVIFTARPNLKRVKKWLKDHDMWQYVTDLTNTKPQAVRYLDDHAEHFTTWTAALAGIRKADTDGQADRDRIGYHLELHGRQLEAQLQQELQGALAELGDRAATAFLSVAQKASVSMLHRLVARVMAQLNLQQWIQDTLLPILRNHAARVMGDTQHTLAQHTGLRLIIGEEHAAGIQDAAGEGLGMADIEPQVRQIILTAVRAGLDRGQNPSVTAQSIRNLVPQGRFVRAGAGYRAQLIAREETRRAQRSSALAAYDSNPSITAVELRDGIYGEPRSDSECIARDGDTVPVAEARAVHPYHVGCTLMPLPVVDASAGQLPIAA